MDIDVEETPQSNAKQSNRKPITSPVDDDHPFDLDSYISNYTGRTAVDRLIHIISTCPSIADQAFHLVVQYIQQLRDPVLYQTALSVYEQSPEARDPPDALDVKWLEETLATNQADRMKLEVELKSYSNNMIKESIRMAHRDLGDFHRATGDYGAALKHYTKSREFCASSQQVLDMCLAVLELFIEQRTYAQIPTYIFKAETALEAVANSKLKEEKDNHSSARQSSSRHVSAERDKVQSKVDFATALGNLGQAHYEKAAFAFVKLGSADKLGDWIGKIVAPGDIAIYGTLCALSSFKRRQIKANILENSTFGLYIEQEPYVRDLIEAYMDSNFKTVLDLLARFSTRHYIDIHLASHVHDLTNLIRNRAVVLYFQPFASIKLDRMGAAFGWTVEEVEQHVVGLIQAGQIQGRVDSQNKILRAKKTDYRAELFARAMKAAEDMQNANRKLLLRMRLQQADLIVKPPKGQPGAHIGEMISQD